MPKMQRYTVEFKDQAVRFVFDEIGPNESRKEACRGLAPKVNVKEVTLYTWGKAASPATANATVRAGQSGTLGKLRSQVFALRKENRDLDRANEILMAASAFLGPGSGMVSGSTAIQGGDRVRCRPSRHVRSRADLACAAGRHIDRAFVFGTADFGS